MAAGVHNFAASGCTDIRGHLHDAAAIAKHIGARALLRRDDYSTPDQQCQGCYLFRFSK